MKAGWLSPVNLPVMNTTSVNHVLSRGIRRDDSSFKRAYNAEETYRRSQLRRDEERRARFEQERVLQARRDADRLTEAWRQSARQIASRKASRISPKANDLFGSLQNLKARSASLAGMDALRRTIGGGLRADQVLQALGL